MRMLYGGLLAMVLTIAFLGQEWIGALTALIEAFTGLPLHNPEWAVRARFLTLAAFFFPAALTVSFPGMLLLAFLTGFLWEARESLVLPDDPLWSADPGAGWGGTIVLFIFLGSLMQGVRPLYLAGRWTLPLTMAVLCIAALVIGEFIWAHVRSGDFAFPPGFWTKTALTTVMTGLATPVVLFLLTRGLIATGCGESLRFSGNP